MAIEDVGKVMLLENPPRRIVVASFWVPRPKEFPRETKMYNYVEMLRVLDGSCKRLGYEHVVLTDWRGAGELNGAGLKSYGIDLPRNLMKAVTEVQAAWLESPYSVDVDTCFVGADCIIRRDIRGHVPHSEFAVAFMKDHKKWRLNTGFMYVPAFARAKVAPLFRAVATDCRPTICDDMAALERALSPMPRDHGVFVRAGLNVAFQPMDEWNHPPRSPDEEAPKANVLHFYGEKSKIHFFGWAKRWGFA